MHWVITIDDVMCCFEGRLFVSWVFYSLEKTTLACASIALLSVKLGKSHKLSRNPLKKLWKTYLPKLKVHLVYLISLNRHYHYIGTVYMRHITSCLFSNCRFLQISYHNILYSSSLSQCVYNFQSSLKLITE